MMGRHNKVNFRPRTSAAYFFNFCYTLLMETVQTRCAIAGGGPAGIVLGYLLARAGIDVTVLEKWPDFFRDFRGDTIHPSTMEILKELGLLEKFLTLPHNKTRQIVGHVADRDVVVADFSRLSIAAPYIAFIPQWDFLNFMTAEAKKYPNFHIYMETEASELIFEKDRVIGLTATNAQGPLTIMTELVIGADGRHSTVREKAGLEVVDLDASIDVLWFRIPRTENGDNRSFNYMNDGKMLVMLNRGDYWQCADIITKGSFEQIKAAGLPEFRKSISTLIPQFTNAIEELKDWEQIKFLAVTVDHLKKWHKPGLLCIGDAAHAMSPAGGVGINLAIHDAVGAANVLIPAFRSGTPTSSDCAKVEQRRSWPARLTQRMQVALHRHLIIPFLANPTHRSKLPFVLWLIQHIPILTHIPAYVIGIGFRSEHVEIADLKIKSNQ
jgi:2-polyprenyl-6-methoxyphenol hydroxylase-like FAD-dependent oxidoreductase